MPIDTIFDLQPFEPTRSLVLPCRGGEITLYVLAGCAYPSKHYEIGSRPRRTIHSVHFNGWVPGFQNAELVIPPEHLFTHEDGTEHYVLEVAFRLIPSEKSGQTAEIVAVSYDGGETFYENELCTLPQEHA